MPAAVVGGAIAAAGAVGSAVISSKGASNAAKAQAQAADASAQVQKDIYDQNAATLRPYINAGMPATNAINSLLGLGGVSQPAQSLPTQQPTTPNALSQFMPYGSYSADGLYNPVPNEVAGNKFPGIWGQFNIPGYNTGINGANVPAPAPTAAAQSPQQNYQTAFDNYRNSTGYQFRLKEGMNALNSGYAGAGMIKSGAAMKAAQDYGQNIASNEFNNYLAALGNQQSLGFSAASAQAGVGQNYANSLSQINQNRADAASNAALLKAQNMGNTINSLASIGANIFGSK